MFFNSTLPILPSKLLSPINILSLSIDWLITEPLYIEFANAPSIYIFSIPLTSLTAITWCISPSFIFPTSLVTVDVGT